MLKDAREVGQPWLASLSCEDIRILGADLGSGWHKPLKLYPDSPILDETSELLDDLSASWAVAWTREQFGGYG